MSWKSAVARIWEVVAGVTRLITATNVDMRSQKLTNLAAGSASGHSVRYEQLIAKANAGANSDITSLSGLTTPLSIAQGGIGATSFVGAKLCQVIQLSYTGNGNDNRNLTGVGFNPNYAILNTVVQGRTMFMKSFSQDDADASSNFSSNQTEANAMQDFITDGVQIGSRAEVNESGEAKNMLLMLTATEAASG